MATAAHTYQSAPLPVPLGRPKYRERKKNIMSDRRVVRGNTYAASITSLNQLAAQAKVTVAAPAKPSRFSPPRHRGGSSGGDGQSSSNNSKPSITVQTEDYLEDLVDVSQAMNQGSQTEDIDEEKPLPVMFVPKPAGIDKQTVIESTDLFDYELASATVLEVLIGKALDQGVAEVMEEEELKNLESRKRMFEEKRDFMITDSQKLEQANLRRYEEKENRLQQERARKSQQLAVAHKIAAKASAREYLAGLQEKVFRKLEKGGHFFDPTVHDVAGTFFPWLVVRVAKRLDSVGGARKSADNLIDDALNKIQEQVEIKAKKERDAIEAKERKRLAEERKVEEEKMRKKKEEEARERAIQEQKEKEEVEAMMQGGEDAAEPAE